MTGLPYRHLQGMLRMTLTDEDTPDYTAIYRRFQSMDVRRDGSVFTVAGRRTGPVALAAGSTGLKQHNRGEWIRRRRKAGRVFVKLHIMVDTDTKRILAIRVTDDTTGDSPMLVPMLDEALGTKERTNPARPPAPADGIEGGCLYGDAAYASRYNVKACRERGLAPIIRLKASSTTRGKGTGDAWGMTVRDQLGGPARIHIGRPSYDEKRRAQEEWKKRAG